MSKIWLVMLLLLTSCLRQEDTYLTQTQKLFYLNLLEKKINNKTNSNYGHVILQYDLLSLASDNYFCADSTLYSGLLDNSSITKREFRKKIKSLVWQINKKARNGSLLDLANKKISLQINHFSNLAKKLPMPQQAKKKFLEQKNPNIFGMVDESFANTEKLAFINEHLSSAPLLLPMKDAKITSVFGKRKSPLKGRNKKLVMHYGVDLTSKKNYQIYATASGTVSFVGIQQGFGKVIIIDHQHGYKSYYAHLDSFAVKEKEQILMGQLIGIQGASGDATDYHLHYEIRYNNKPLDPNILWQANSNCSKF